MNLPVLALLDRSLRVETRSVLMGLARVAMPGMILVSLLSVASTVRFGAFGAPGLRVFESVMWLNFFFATLAGLSYFASAVAEEKEEMTLGLLRMTGLSPLAILLGKSTARGVGAAIMLLVQLPFTLLAVAMGGVTLLQILAAYGVLLAYLFFLCNLAVAWSVVTRQTTHAAAATGGCLAIFLLGPPLGLHLMRAFRFVGVGAVAAQGWGYRALAWAGSISPFEALDTTFKTAASLRLVGVQMAVDVALGLGCFLLAWALFDRCTREQKEAAPSRAQFLWRGGRSSRVPPRIVGGRALTWKDNHFLQGGALGQVAKTVLLGLVFAAIACAPLLWRTPITREYAGGSIMMTSLTTLAVALAVDASRIFREEVRWKTLTALMTLPFSVREVAYRKVAGSLLALLPVAGYFLVGLLLYPKVAVEAINAFLREKMAFLTLLYGLVQFVLFLHLVAYLSLVVKRGALPLAIGIYYTGSMFIFTPLVWVAAFAGQMGQGIMWLLTMTFTLVLTAGLHWKIGRRLVRAAGEE